MRPPRSIPSTHSTRSGRRRDARRLGALPGAAAALLQALLLAACGSNESLPPGARLSSALSPTRPPAFYVEQANLYFDGLDLRADPSLLPNYAELVARWELPPWLWLTGYGRQNMIDTTRAALALDPSTVPTRDCRAFPTQPFARCVVSFEYAQGACPIYEEFTFDDQGEMTFIEAWSDLPGFLPNADPADRWAEGREVRRLSTRVPGLGSPEGTIDLDSSWMQEAAARDPEVADFVRRARDFWPTWLEALSQAGPDYFARGCGWR
ncbi:MAG: hypothetical protein WCH13_00485 [Deltaproteobacteria bacterium]